MNGRCEVCPVGPGRDCLGQSHRAVCDDVRAGMPGRASQLVALAAAEPGEAAGPDDPDDPRPGVGIMSPCCNLGGADLWVSDLLGSVDPTRVRWSGTACRDDTGIPINPSVRASWERHGPFGAGYAAMSALAARSSLVVVWGAFHSWGFPPAALAALVGTTPLLVVSHGATSDRLGDPGGMFPSVRAAAVSRAGLRGLPPELAAGARVILNAIAPGRVRASRPAAETLASIGVPAGTRVLGWIGRLAPDKRPAVFFDAVAALPPGWMGVVAGSGYGEREALAHAAAVCPGRVAFLGERHDVGDLLSTFDAFCMPSAGEACSLAAGEAWLAGVPLISTATGLLEERPELARIVPNPPTGLDLAGAILADLADPAGTAARVAMAREFAASALAPARFGREWTDAIVEAAPARRRPGLGPAVRDAVVACPDRGPVLPVSLQPDCGCRGAEVSECRAGRGSVPGRVTLRECLACREADQAPSAGPARH